jgi:dienelactone hydrolase
MIRTCSAALPFLGLAVLLLLEPVTSGGAPKEPAQPLPVDKQIRHWADEAPLRLRFTGVTAADCRAWQAAFTKKLHELLGPFQPPATWHVVVERTVDLDDHRREEVLLIARGLPPLPVYLLIPRGAKKGRCPGIVAVHGHGPFGYDAVVGRELTPGIEGAVRSSNYDYGRQLVRRGYVVVAPCLMPFGRRLGDLKDNRGADVCGVTFVRMQLLGKLLIAENLRDILWALEFLARHEVVDGRKLGCVGLSYGGRMTMLATALEPRIRVAVIAGALNCLQERIKGRYGCGAQVIPGLLQYGDVPEIGSLIAPRPCMWEVGARDKLLPEPWVAKALERMTRAYEVFGARDQLLVNRFDGGHRWDSEPANRFLDRVLKD